MVSSPYARAMQTAAIFASALEYPKQKIRRSDSLLPGAEPGAFLRELAREKNVSSVFCFGHAPHVDGLLAAAVGAPHHITSIKKAGIAFVELKRLSPPNTLWLFVTRTGPTRENPSTVSTLILRSCAPASTRRRSSPCPGRPHRNSIARRPRRSLRT